jgi:7-cyano-7-deazaguanine synthase
VSKAVILLSGGLDSATTLAIAKSEGYECFALSVNYHQRHIAELEAAKKIAAHFNVKDHKTVELDLSWMLTSALTNPELKVPTELSSHIPITYVPARNTLMLTLALGWAEVIGAHDIFIGVNAVDYSGYPDCRPEYIMQFQKMANLATKSAVESKANNLHTPFIDFYKDWITRHDLPRLAGGKNGERLQTRAGENTMYSYGALLTEWMVGKIGLPGLLRLMKDTESIGWQKAFERNMGKSSSDLLTEMATYLYTENKIISDNKWIFLPMCKSYAINKIVEFNKGVCNSNGSNLS